MNPPFYPVDAIAKLLNLTPRRVQQLVREGVIPKPEKGKYDLIRTIRAYVKYLQDRVEQQRAQPRELHEERMRLLTAQAEHKELEVGALYRSLLPFEEVVAAWQQLVAAFRARCLALPSKLAPRLAVIHERKKIQADLSAELREALQELARFDLAGSASARGPQGGPGRKPPAGSNGKSVGRPTSAAESGRQRRARTVPVH